MSILDLFHRAVSKYGAETVQLRWLPENRYDRNVFPTTGQYDWFDGQLLYCLVRELRPKCVLEISMSSGYSTMFMALALRANGGGIVNTFELDGRAIRAARKNFERWHVADFVCVHEGDARVTTVNQPDLHQSEILFLDSLHTEEFARWFVERFVLQAADNALFHVHDILPPPERRSTLPIPLTWRDRLFTVRWIMRDPRRIVRRRRQPVQDGGSEELFIRRLAERMVPGDYVYLYDVVDQFPELSPRAYDHLAVGRGDADGKPREWNESFWCFAGAVRRAYKNHPSSRP